MYALTESITLSQIKKHSCTLLLFEIILCLAAFPFSRAQSGDTTIFPDDPDLKPTENGKVCYTPECIRTATRVLSFINASLDPCDNFYKFACGQFITTNFIHGVNSVDQSSLVKNNIQGQMIDYLRNKTLSTLPRYARLIKTFFSSCIADYPNKEKERTINSITKFINEINGWPLLKNDPWEDENFQWENFGSQTEYINILYKSFIHVRTFPFYTVKGWKSDHFMRQPRKLDESQESYNNLLYFGQLFGVKKNAIENSFKQMLKVNSKLQEIYSNNISENSINRAMTVNELVQKYPNVSWKEFFNMRVQPKIIDDDDVIFVNHVSYFDKFNRLIPTISKRDQANYLIWRVIYQMSASYLDILKTKNYLFEICHDSTFENFNMVMGFFYTKNNFNNDLFAKETDEMFHNIHEEYNTILKNNSWLDDETKLKALEKLESIIAETPSQYLSYDEEIDEYYKSLEITPGDYFQSLFNITEFNRKYQSIVFPSLGPGNKKSWKQLKSATTVNAVYYREKNLISLTPVLFQRVYFNEERPKYMNYGSMGSTIAHEISHAFDSGGRNYDKKGERVNWWTSEANAKFLHKVQCIINQYNHYRVEEIGLNLNGYRTQDENIADFVGLEVAYLAYEKYMETHGSEPLLPDVNYTQRQLFWISYAQIECSIKTTKELKNIAERTRYSSPEYRVIGPLSNSLKFARDFQCEPKTKMNPMDKCTFW